MLVLSISGILLLVKRVGGWRNVARPLHGSRNQRWHAEVGRIAIFGLLLSALTGTYMSAATLSLVSDGMQNEADFPAATSGGPPAPVIRLPALVATDLADLRELVFPTPGDRAAVYTLHKFTSKALLLRQLLFIDTSQRRPTWAWRCWGFTRRVDVHYADG